MYAASPWQKRFLVPRVVSSHRMLTLLCITLRTASAKSSERYLALLEDFSSMPMSCRLMLNYSCCIAAAGSCRGI